MNKDRRKAIAAAAEALDKLKESVESHQVDVEGLKDEEQEYLDAMPEALQGGDKYSAGEEAVSKLEEANDALTEAVSNLETAIEALNGVE
jgi:predicted  nucleic acid-binding Zn-ribbon protein